MKAATTSKLFIGGALVDALTTRAIEVRDPATEEVLGEVPAAGAADIERAVQAAQDCFHGGAWRRLSATDRAAVMWKLSDDLLARIDEYSTLDVRDNGMPLAFARGSILSAINGLRYYAGMCTKIQGTSAEISGNGREMHAYTTREPVGVVGAITPWNAPLAVAINKIAPAIAAGCSIVLKPAEQTPLSALRFGELLANAPMPAGLINIVTGYGDEAGAALAAHRGIDKITFTGSTAVGKKLIHAAADNLKRVTLELGGKSPVFVFDDADLDKAIAACTMAIFANSGQVCFAGSRLYIQRRSFQRVTEGVSAAAKALRLGSGLDPATQLGPLVSEEQMSRVLAYVESGVAEGGELLCGGRRVGDRGFFVSPAVFATDSKRSMRITREEIFGPVVVAMPFEDTEELQQLANDTEYGLGAGIFTTSLSRAHRAAKLIRAGNVWLNCYGVLDKAMPFGGFRQSGWGREGGFEGLDAFLETKSVYSML